MWKFLNRAIASFLVVVLVSTGMPVEVQAASVGTGQALEAGRADEQRASLRALLERDEVREQLQSLGVSADDARARVDALTDDEVAAVAGRLEELPAGASSVVGVLVFIFVLLLVTDILGLTKVFPFTRPVR